MATRCGTLSGFSTHQRHGEKPCPACCAAKAAYDKRRKAAPEQIVKSRLAARAQGRAYMALAHMFPDMYHALYQVAIEELREDD